jgi:hypothetical protein
VGDLAFPVESGPFGGCTKPVKARAFARAHRTEAVTLGGGVECRSTQGG